MAFPTEPRDIRVELYLADEWSDVSHLVYSRDEIKIKRGRSDESPAANPSTCALTLNNRSGAFSPRNPLGPFYGTLGRATPMRVSVGVNEDQFGRTVSSNWGLDWSTAATAGVASSDFNVTPGAATMRIPVANELALAADLAVDQADVDVAVTVNASTANVAGASLLAVVLIRGGNTFTDAYRARLIIATDETMQIDLITADGTAYAIAPTALGFSWNGTPVRMRVQAEGRVWRMKVWRAADPEPYDWITGASDEPVRSGWTGLRCETSPANSNVPVTFTFTDYQVRSPRFSGEVAEWPAVTDPTGRDATVEIEASGPLRRLNQGKAPQASCARRAIGALPGLREYWPLEDGKTAVVGLSATGGAAAWFHQELQLTPAVGAIEWADDDDLPGSDAAPRIHNGGYLTAQVRPLLFTSGRYAVSWSMRYSAADGARLRMRTDNPGLRFTFTFYTDGSIEIYEVIDPSLSGSTLRMTVPAQDIGAFDWKWRSYLFYVDQSGSGITWQFYIDGVLKASYTATPGLRGLPAMLEWSTANVDNNGTVLAHIAVTDSATYSALDLLDAVTGYDGEPAAQRIVRLCVEADVPWAAHGSVVSSPDAGPQPIDTLVNLLEDAAVVDAGTLYESRGVVGLAFRTLASQGNQPVVATMSYTAGELDPPFRPVDDDQTIRNDVKASRPDGGDIRVEETTGRLSTLPPEQGGVGRYDTSITAHVSRDEQLVDVAGWRLHHGTIDEARFPKVRVNLANPTVAANTTLSAAVLDVDVDSRITVTSVGPLGFADPIRQVVRGYTEKLAQYTHEFEFNCTPASALDVFELGDGVSRLASSTSTLAAGVTSSATSLSVADTGGERWTTDPTDMPFDILVGGERMTVTAITGTSSPQTFTVTRAINGVAKAHSAGEAVALARRATITP